MIENAQHGFWYYNWGNVASCAGLLVSIGGIVITILALRAAESARDAAQAAKAAARIWAHGDEVRRGENLTRDLASLLANGNLQASALRGKDLLELLRLLVELWIDEDGVDAKTHLIESRDIATQTYKILRKISTNSQNSSSRETDLCINHVDQIYERLLKVRATLDRRRN
jgi:hypothetical protein